MLTLNVISHGDTKVITGTVSSEKFSLNFDDGIYTSLLKKKEELPSIQTMEAYEKWVQEVKDILATDTEDVITTSCPDLIKSTKGFYHVKVDGVISKKAVPQAIVAVILKSVDQDIDPTPIVKAWIRFLRNPNFSSEKAELFARYITAEIIDWDEVKRLQDEEGFTYEIAILRATYNDVAITQEGLIVGKKYARLLTEGWEIDTETNKAVKTKLSYIEDDSINPHTGEIYKGGVKEDVFNEDLLFEPPVMGVGGDEFYCGAEKGHYVRVGVEHHLPDWSYVNTDDNTAYVKGLHVGGWQYVQSYKGLNCQLLECFIDPAEIGAIVDITQGDGAMRVKSYFVYGATTGRNKGIYHSSHYAAMKDKEWEEYKKKAVEESNKLIGELTEEITELGQ
jgi:hypothetical protein